MLFSSCLLFFVFLIMWRIQLIETRQDASRNLRLLGSSKWLRLHDLIRARFAPQDSKTSLSKRQTLNQRIAHFPSLSASLVTNGFS